MAKIIIPTPLRKFTNNASSFDTDQSTVKGAIDELIKTFPEVGQNIIDKEGNIRQFIKVFVGDNDINSLHNGETKVEPHTIISIIPAIAGG